MAKRKFVEVYPGAGPKMMIPAKKMRAVRRMEARQYAPPTSRWLNRRGVASKETGYVDLATGNYDLDTTGDVALIATIAQGASVNQRVGKKVLLKSLQIRALAGTNSGTAQDQRVAILVVYDKRPTGSLPAVTDILATASAYANNNDANSGRFEIVRRMDFRLGKLSLDSGTRPITEFVPLRNRPAVFKAAGTGAIGDIEQGALYLVTVGSVAAGVNAASVDIGFRTRFVDV